MARGRFTTPVTRAPHEREASTTISRRLFGAYAALVTVAVAVLIFAPVTISVPVALTELAGLLLGLVAMLVVFRVLLGRVLAPLEHVTGLMKRVDPLSPGQRIDVHAREAEVVALADAFNGMLDRLEGERRDSARRALAAQEGERQRIARELHDEIGQVLTAIMLRTDALARRAPIDLQSDLEALREAARDGAEEVRGLASRLRPEALDELGLHSALQALCTAVAGHSGLPVHRTLQRDLPLSEEQELVIYRVAQEGLTNVVRHASATLVEVTLIGTREGGVRLTIRDHGDGIARPVREGTGLRGMRERALLVGATLSIEPLMAGGTLLTLDLPAAEVR